MSEQDRNPAAEREDARRPAPVIRDEHDEATLTRMIEHHTARVPSHWFLAAAFGAMGLSVALEIIGRSRWSRFVGMWPGPLLVTGVYNKLVKALGPR